MPRTINKVILHHSAYSPNVPQFELVNGWHKDRNFPKSSLGKYVGYHYFIEKDGTVLQARTEDEQGAHTFGENTYSIGVCLAGNFSLEYPTKKQVASLRSLLASIGKRHSLEIWDVHPHRMYKATECYGTNLPDQWGREQYIHGWIAELIKLLHELREKQAKL